MIGLLIAAIAVLVALIWGYNKAVILKNYVSEGFATMDVYLKKRWDLLPNLIETVKSYTAHEKDLLTDLTKIRSQNYDTLSDGEKLNANMQIGKILPRIHAVAENYPDLKANQNFMDLSSQLKAVEEDIANARKYYNAVVKRYNNNVMMFPSNLIAGMFHFEKAPMFELDDASERKNVKVSF
jgi:LemA protein